MPTDQKTVAAQCKVHAAEIEHEISKYALEKTQALRDCAAKDFARAKILASSPAGVAASAQAVDKAQADYDVAHANELMATLDVELKKTKIDELKAELYADLNPVEPQA